MANQRLYCFFVSEQTDTKELLKGLGNAFQKAGDDFSLAFVGPKEVITPLQDSKSLKKRFREQQAHSFADINALQKWIATQEEQEVILALGNSAINLPNVHSTIEKTEFHSHQWYQFTPDTKVKNNRIPLKNKSKNLVRQLMAGFPSVDEHNAFFGLNSALFLSICQSKIVQHAKSHQVFFALQKAAYCHGVEVIDQKVGFGEIQTSPIGFLGAIKRETGMGLKSRVNYMVGDAIRQMKASSDNLSNGNSGLYRMTFLFTALILMFVMPILSFGFGITWDEINIIVYAEDILDYFFSFGENKNVLNTQGGRDYNVLINYGLFFDSFAALVNKFTPFGIYQTRHMLNALVGFGGVFFTGLLAREAGTWRTGVFGLLILALSPYYFGHAMNNPKDIPFAAGFAMSLYFLVRYLKQLPNPKTSTLLLLTLAIGFVNSIRFGGLLLIGFMGLMTGFQWLIMGNRIGFGAAFKKIPAYAKYITGVTLGSYILGILVWPYGLQDPINNPFKALEFFTNFSGVTIYEVFEGKRIYMNEVPWYYIPKFLIIGNPLFAVFGAALALLPLFWYKRSTLKTPVMWFMAFALVFPIAYAVYGESTLYNGWRHFIFVYPAMVVLAAGGWEFLVTLFQKRVFQLGMLTVLGALMINTLVWMVKYHPNEYVYYNELVGGYSGAYGNYELDTYGNGIRGAFETLVEEFPEVKENGARVAFNMTGWDWKHPTTADAFGDSVRGTWVREYERFRKPWDYAIFFPRTFTKNELQGGAFPPKGTIYVEEIEGKPLYAIVKREHDYMVNGHKYIKQNQYRKAITELEKAVEYDPMLEEAWRNLGMAYLNTGQLEKAKEALEKAVSIRPESHIAHSYLGVYYSQKGELQKAIEEFELSKSLKINYSYPLIQLGNLYYQTGNYALAIDNYETGLERLGRLDVGILNQIGACYIQLRNFDEAIRIYQLAIQENPNYADAYQNIGVAYAQMGDQQKAQQYMQKAQELSGR